MYHTDSNDVAKHPEWKPTTIILLLSVGYVERYDTRRWIMVSQHNNRISSSRSDPVLHCYVQQYCCVLPNRRVYIYRHDHATHEYIGRVKKGVRVGGKELAGGGGIQEHRIMIICTI